MSLKEIIYPIQSYIELFDRKFSECISAEGFFVDDISKYVFKKQGKKIRPIITFLSANIAGRVTDQTIRCAVILELLHTASLVHDDVLDQSDMRRGEGTVNKIWGENTAVLFGDYLYGKCLELIETESDFMLMPIYAKIGKELPLGELLQKEVSENLDYSEDSYYKVISKKTAALLEVSAEIGAKSAKADIEIVNSLKTFGYYAGLAFQIKDDILDFSSDGKTGKPYGNDIREKKITLPLIYMLNDLSPKEREEVLSFIKSDDKSEDMIQELIYKVKDGDYLNKAEEQVKHFCSIAEIQLRVFENTQYKESLVKLLYFLVERNN